MRAAVGQLAPDELPHFDEVWQAYLDDARDAAHILRSRDAALGAGMEVIATAMTPLIAAITGEALAGMVKEPAAGAVRKVSAAGLPTAAQVSTITAGASFGHPAADYAVGLGRRAGARRVLLAHHKPDRTDDALDELAARFRADPRVTVAAEGQVVEV